MMIFFVVAALLLAAALLFIVPPLWRQHGRKGVQRDRSNLEIYKDQLAELEADLANATISEEQFEQGRIELERRLLDEVAVPAAAPAAVRDDKGAGRGAALSIALFIPLLAALIYLVQGNPQAISPQKAATVAADGANGPGHAVTMDQIQNMVTELAQRMESNPNDAEGWMMLGRSYAALGRYAESSAAFERAVALVPENADLLVDYADALAMSSGETLEGKPMQLIGRALGIDPNNQKGLWLAGTAAYDRGDFNGAIAHWEKLLASLPQGSQEAQAMISNIAEARSLIARAGGVAPAPSAAETAVQQAPAAASVEGTVKIKPELAAKVAPTDTVFIFARAQQGPPMPLAVMRAQVKDLPLKFHLDDSMAVAPMAPRLSSVAQVEVGARISKSGEARAQSGDLQGTVGPVRLGSAGVEVVIDSVVP